MNTIEVKIPKEISQYQEKFIFGLSIRQLLCFFITVVMALSTYYLLLHATRMSSDLASYIIILESVPILSVGFLRINDQKFERFFVLFLRYHMRDQLKVYRVYQSIIGDNKHYEVQRNARKTKSDTKFPESEAERFLPDEAHLIASRKRSKKAI
jgi:hypothetical protein